MKVLIGILSCHQYQDRRNSQRETWIRDVPWGVDCKFFVGLPHDANLSFGVPDVLKLNCEDGYGALSEKTRLMADFALRTGYDYLFKCDDDTYVRVDRLFASGFEQHDYSGIAKSSIYFGEPRINYAQGGAGYWLSRKAMEAVVSANHPVHSAEDVIVGRILHFAKIPLFNDERYRWADDRLSPDNDFITSHRVSPKEMRELHQKFLLTRAE